MCVRVCARARVCVCALCLRLHLLPCLLLRPHQVEHALLLQRLDLVCVHLAAQRRELVAVVASSHLFQSGLHPPSGGHGNEFVSTLWLTGSGDFSKA